MSDTEVPPYVNGPDHRPPSAPPLGSTLDTGVKFDDGKLRYDLVPALAERAVVEVLSYGARKYAPDNWRKVPEPRARYLAAARRHLAAWQLGEKNDADSGQSHLAHATCCLMFLLELDAA